MMITCINCGESRDDSQMLQLTGESTCLDPNLCIHSQQSRGSVFINVSIGSEHVDTAEMNALFP